MTFPYYATVEQVARATDFKSTSLQYSSIARLLDAASRNIEEAHHRHYYPLTETVTYDLRTGGVGFWLERDLYTLTSVVADGTAVALAGVTLYPLHFGPPYSWVEVPGQVIELTGVWGYSADEQAAGALSAAMSDETGTDASVTDASKVGIGDLIKIGDERMVVTDKALADTTANLAANLDALESAATVAVNTGSLVKTGEVITVGSERMLVISIASNNLTVKRAWDGSVLAAHTSSDDVYAPRTLTVERGAVGTTATTHLTAAAITRNVAPGPIVELCIAETIVALEQESAGYGRVVGSGENQREARGVGLEDARRRADRFRRVRMAAV